MTERNGYPKNFFRANEVIHNVAGIWVFNTEQEVSVTRKCLKFMWSFIMRAVAALFLLMELIMFSETIKDFSKLISQFGMFLSSSLGVMKGGILVLQHDRLKRIIDTLQDKHYQYDSLDDFKPGDLLCRAKRQSQMFSIMLCLSYVFTGVTAHVSSQVMLNKEVKGNLFEGNTTCYDFLSFYFYIPFPSDTKSKCEFVFSYMNFSLFTFAWTIACHDGFYAALLNCLKTQLIILGDAIRVIRQRVLKRMEIPGDMEILHDQESPTLEQELNNEMNHVSKHLIILIEIAVELENIFNLVTLCQALVSFIIFASCLFVAANIPVTSPEFFAQMEYFLCMLLQLGIYCWYGSEITRASEEIKFALYDCEWTSASKRFKSSLLITMSRIQRPVYLSFGKFCPLTLDSWVAICKCAFSYYTVFKSMKE